LGNGAGGLGTASQLDTGNAPQSIAIADFDEDGMPDLAVANQHGDSISILLNTSTAAGTAAFAAKTDFSVAPGVNPYSVTSADFDGDNHADLAVANANSGKVTVLLGDGAGSFAAAKGFDAAGSLRSVTSADFNGDGKPDIAVVSDASNKAYVLLNTSTGFGNINLSFAAAVNFSVGTSPQSITSADFDGDGKFDLAVANWSSNNVSVLLNSTPLPGTASFGAAANFAAGTNPVYITSADFDADGKPDLAVANGASSNFTTVLLNTFPDSTAPTGTIVIDAGNASTNSTAVTLTLTCTDDVGCTQMQFSNDNATWSTAETNATSKSWTLALGGADGVRTVYARFMDTAGNMSAVVNDQITLDTAPPAAPSITAPANNTVTTSTARPAISGTAEADATVTVKDGATSLGSVTATGGNFSLASGGATLSEGVHSFMATATDPAGNAGPASTAITYTVDTTAPAITKPANITVAATGAAGIAKTNAAITAFLNAAVTADAVDGAGLAANNAPATFPIGTTTVTFSATDSTGNTATPVTATVTVTAPPSPTPASGADLTISKLASFNPVAGGGLQIYTLTITNLGPQAASDVIVSDPLPDSLDFILAIPSQGTCTGTVNILCSLGTLANGAAATVLLAVMPQITPVLLTNTASVTATTPDPDSSNNLSQVLSTMSGPVAPVVASLALNAASFVTGDTLILSATATPGASPIVADVYLAIQLPDGTLFFMGSDGGFSSTIGPALTDWTVVPFAGPVFSYTFNGSEPVGQYEWFLILIQTGTANLIGPISIAPFTFTPT